MTDVLAPPRHSDIAILSGKAALAELDLIVAGLEAGRVIPYLGPGILGKPEDVPVPTTPEALAAALHARLPAPGRIRTNMWSVAQFIEQRRHRKTLVEIMAAIFAPAVAPTALHRALAGIHGLPMIVDVWYDGAMRSALAGRDFLEIQGVTRALEFGDVWTRAYDAKGESMATIAPDAPATILYKPHGAITPARNFLIADSDYVEVLTEIDIQTPIPEIVRERRTGRDFLFLGCRFHDQMLRTFARQISKRSSGRHFALVSEAEVTRNELKFFTANGISPLALPVDALVERLQG